jgi:hypothetical protein
MVAQATPGAFWTWVCIAEAIALATFYAAYRFLRRARLIEDTPTSLLRSAAQGYVQIEGNARHMPGPEIISPISMRRCVWWRYRIEELRSKSDGKTEWETLESGGSDDLFLLVDHTGDCIVDPEGAEVLPSISRTWRGYTPRPQFFPERTRWIDFGRYRYQEHLVLVGDSMYATGWFRTESAQQEFNDAGEVRELLAEWKRDRHEMLRRFDANGDGQIDMQEWETARRAAFDQVRAQQVERASDPDLNVLSAPPTGQPFVLSTAPRDRLVRRYKWYAVAALAASVVAFLIVVQLLRARGIF